MIPRVASSPWLRAAVPLALALALPARAREGQPPPSLKSRIDRIVERPAFDAGFWGIEVRSLTTGKVLYARNPRKNMKPASTAKLLVTAAALDAFGPDERFRTTVEAAGAPDSQGTLRGDVFLVGRGDANLSGRFNDGHITAAFEEMADALVRAGVRRIDGRIVGHEGLFKGDRRGEDWGWEDLVWWYGAEVSALSFNDNCADLRLAPGERVGEAARVERNPPSRYYSVVSTVTTSPAGAEEDLTLRRDPGSNVVRLSGTYPLGEKAWVNSVALEDPALYASTVFSEVLAAKGVSVGSGVATTSEALPAGLRVLAEHLGPPLSQVIQAVNKPSQNLHAEILLRMLGARIKGEGTAEAGHAAVVDFLRRIGVTGETSSLRDGSGLSRSDLIPPHDLVDLLVGMDRHPYAAVFRDSLPIAGTDGSLRHRMKGTRAEGRIVAKTGSIRNVSAIAGYATTLGGERLALAILANHHTGPSREVVAAIDEIGQLLVGGGASPRSAPAPRTRRKTKGAP